MRAAGFSADLSGRMTTPHSDSARAIIPKAVPKRQVTSSWNSTDGKPLLKTASAADLARARSIVADAIAASAERNKARLANPARNQYRLKPGTVIGGAATAPNNNNNNNNNKRRGRRKDQKGSGDDAAPLRSSHHRRDRLGRGPRGRGRGRGTTRGCELGNHPSCSVQLELERR
ncbi:hypothetical protein VTI74DRAFT_6054 [Chaetomium olivicolor]